MDYRKLLALTSTTFLTTTFAADAQPAPPPPRAAGAPRAVPGRIAPDATSGIITESRPYYVRVRTDRGREVAVHLARGTVIDPTGTSLVTGMRVTIVDASRRSDGSLDAGRIALAPPMPPVGKAPPPPGGNAPPPPAGQAPQAPAPQ